MSAPETAPGKRQNPVPWWLPIGCVLPLALGVAAGDDTVRPDPLPLRRIQIGPDRVAAELERVQKGTLVLLPLAEFEARVQDAALAAELTKVQPRLTRTRFAARLAGQALVGDASWSVVQTANGPGILPLPDFNLALNLPPAVRQVAAEHDGAAAFVLGDFDGKTPGLWIAKPGQTTIDFDWSRRGTAIGNDLHFDLQIPACANAEIELTLPVDYRVVAGEPGLLVDGPHAAENEALRTWLIQFSGKSHVEFGLHSLASGKALLLVAAETRQELSPDRVAAEYEFQIEALHGTVSQLVFDGDASLRPWEVTIGGAEVKTWEWRTAAGGKGAAGNVLVVPLGAPRDGKLPALCVRALVPVVKDGKDRQWVSPALSLRGAVSRGETLKLHAPSEAQLENWKPGQFRLVKTNTEPDGSLLITLVHGGSAPPRPPAKYQQFAKDPGRDFAVWPPVPPPERPSALLKSPTTAFLMEQRSWFQVDLQGSTLTSELVCKVSRGQLYHLPLKLPQDSQVEQFSLEPKELLRGWATAPPQKGVATTPTLLIDLAKPATPERPLKIKLQLRLPARQILPKGGFVNQPLPDVEPLVPCLREGTLAVSVHPRWRAQLFKSSVPATAAPEGEGAWPQGLPDYYFAFRGGAATGQLRLFPRAAQFQARCQSDAYIGGTRGALVTRLTLQPTSGSLNYVDLLVSANLAEPWRVRADSTGPRVVAVQRLRGLDPLAGLLTLGATHGLQAASILAAEPGFERWRLRFAEPVRGRVALVLEAPFDPVVMGKQMQASGEQAWAVPVVDAVGAEQFDGELAVQVAGAEITWSRADQLQEVGRLPGKVSVPRGVQQVWRVFGYDGAGAAAKLPRLHLKARPLGLAGAVTARESCDSASLTTSVQADGRLAHHFHFRLVNWHTSDLAVQLPAGAEVLSARSEGRWLPSLPLHAGDGGPEVILPASPSALVQHFDVYYATQGPPLTWQPWATIAAAAPLLPVRPLNLRHSWVLPPGFLPRDTAWQRVAGDEAGAGSRRETADFGTPWETAVDEQPAGEIVIVRPAALSAAGIFLGGVLALAWGFAAWTLRSPTSRPWRLRLLVLWTGAAFLGVVWLPASMRIMAAWPLGAAAAIGAVWYVVAIVRPTRRLSAPLPGEKEGPEKPSRALTASASAVVLAWTVAAGLGLAAAGSAPVWSQGADPSTVLVLPGPADAPDRQDVLVTPDLLKKLDNLIQRGPGGLRGAILTAARYDGNLEEDVASFKASLRFHSFGPNAVLTIPLTGVVLHEGALLDGTPVQPVAAPGGYAVAVKDQGPHLLTLAFTARLQTATEHRDLQFNVPRLLASQLRLRLPAAWPEAQSICGVGQAQSAPVNDQQQELAVELGREEAVHLRWPGGKATTPKTKVTVREGYYWDLQSPGSTCTAQLRYTVKAGSVSQFQIALPATLEPRGVEVSGDGSGDDGTRPRLKDWHLAAAKDKGQWQLRIHLQGPATGIVFVTVDLVPRQPLGPGKIRLLLPQPLGAVSEGGLVGYRIDGLDSAEQAVNLMTLVLPAEQFTRQWQELGGGAGVEPTRAFSFRNRTLDAGLAVVLTPRPPVIEQDLQWTLRPNRADLAATLKATAATNDLSLVEWEVPAEVVIAEITGANVRSWTRTAGQARVQIWLQQPARSVAVSLRGWHAYAEPARGQDMRWPLPWLHCASAGSLRTVVRVVAGGGTAVEPDPTKFVNLSAMAGAASAWVCQGPIGRYSGEFIVSVTPQPAQLTGVTLVETLQGKLRVSGQWQVQVPHGGLARFQVSVANWQGPPLNLEGPGVSKLDAPPGQQRWQVAVPSGAPRRMQLKVRGLWQCPPGTVAEMPVFVLEGAVWTGHWLAARTPGLDVKTAAGLTALKDATAEPGLVALGAAAIERLHQPIQLWKTSAADWRLALVVRPPAAAPGLRMLLAEQEVAFGEGFGWIHQTRYWLHVKDGSEVLIDMPPGAVLLAASISGEQINPRSAAGRLAVVLPPGEGLYCLLLRWVFGFQAEPLAMPQLALPRIGGVPAPPVNWTLTVPPGFRLSEEAAALEQPPPLAAARHELARALALTEAVQLLAAQWQKTKDEALKVQLAQCQALFARHSHLAAVALESATEEVAAARGDLKQRLTSLERSWAAVLKNAGLEKTRLSPEEALAAAKRAEASQLSSRGTVFRWQTGNLVQPHVELLSLEADVRRQAWAAAAWVTLGVLCLFVLSHFPRALVCMQHLWPEQMAAVAVVLWAAGGFGAAAAALLVLALLARLLTVRTHWRRQAVVVK